MAFDGILILPGIPGETQDEKYKADSGIDILSFSWGLTQSGSAHLQKGAGSASANFQDLTITKAVDSASPKLMEFCALGTVIDPAATGKADCKLVVRKASGDKAGAMEYFIVYMNGAYITSYSTGAGGGDGPILETVSFNFFEIRIDYNPQEVDGAPAPTIEFGYNIENKVSVT